LRNQIEKDRFVRLREEVLVRIGRQVTESEADVAQCVNETLQEEDYKTPMCYQERLKLEKYLYQSICGYDVIQDLIDDEAVTEIMINGANSIFYEKDGRLQVWKEKFASEKQLMEMIQRIVGAHDRRVNASTPIVDSRLPGGSRVNIVLPPISTIGPVVTIRKFAKEVMSLNKLIQMETFPMCVGDYLANAVRTGQTIFISGGTGSGKTTLLNALTECIGQEERVITIEDSKELLLKDCPNWVSLESKPANMEGEGEVKIRDLIRTALRMRPDRIIVGEVRGGECLDLLQALNTGHRGSLSTGHGNSCEDMLNRLETMALMGMEMPIGAIRKQIVGGIQLMVHMQKNSDGKRKLCSVKRVKGMNGGEICLEEIYGNNA